MFQVFRFFFHFPIKFSSSESLCKYNLCKVPYQHYGLQPRYHWPGYVLTAHHINDALATNTCFCLQPLAGLITKVERFCQNYLVSDRFWSFSDFSNFIPKLNATKIYSDLKPSRKLMKFRGISSVVSTSAIRFCKSLIRGFAELSNSKLLLTRGNVYYLFMLFQLFILCYFSLHCVFS